MIKISCIIIDDEPPSISQIEEYIDEKESLDKLKKKWKKH